MKYNDVNRSRHQENYHSFQSHAFYQLHGSLYLPPFTLHALPPGQATEPALEQAKLALRSILSGAEELKEATVTEKGRIRQRDPSVSRTWAAESRSELIGFGIATRIAT